MTIPRGTSDQVSGLPFVCARCGMRWGDGRNGPGAIRVTGDMNAISFSNVTMTCPRCGTPNRPALPDGTYNIRQGRWELVRQLVDDLRSAQAEPDDYAKLISVLREAQASGKSAERVAEAVGAATPFARIAKTISEHPPGWTAYLIAALLAIILWRFPYPSQTPPAAPANPPSVSVVLPRLTNQELDNLAKQIARQLEQRQDLSSQRPQSVPTQKGSQRNKPCPCGSKAKYKKCHGDPVRRPAPPG